MYKEQDIFRIHTSNQLGAMDGGTSVVMFPLRLETKIIKKKVTKYKDQAGVLLVMKPLFDTVLSCLGRYQGDDAASTETLISRFLDSVLSLQTIYKEDRAIIYSVIDLICKRFPADSDSASMLKTAKEQLSKVAVVSSYSDNRAANLIKELRFHFSRTTCDSHYGKKRKLNGDYSTIRYFIDGARHVRAASKFARTLPKRLNEIPSLDNQQYKVLKSLLSSFKACKPYYFEKSIADNLGYIERKNKAKQKLSGVEKSLSDAKEVFDKAFTDFAKIWNKDQITILNNLLAEKRIRYAKTQSTYRYSRLAYVIMNCMLSDKYPSDKRYKSIWTIAGHTVFEYHQELEWIRKVVSEYNLWAGQYRKDLVVSLERLNKYSGYIKRRKMTVTSDEQDALCVRIYPDDLAVSQLSKRISRKEYDDGLTFVNEFYDIDGAAAGAADPKQYAWDRLCMKYPPYRAAWIVRTMVVNNIDPAKYDFDEDVFSIPVSTLMPTRFTVQAVLKTGLTTQHTITRYGNRLPEELKVGINFNEKDAAEFDDVFSRDPENGLKFKDGLRWMTDYDEAERIGMAVTVPLSDIKFSPRAGKNNCFKPSDYEFSAVYVTGCRQNIDISGNEGSKILEDVFLCHLYSEEGLDIINTSTPTNILDDSTDTSYNTSTDVLSAKFFNLLCRALPKSMASLDGLSWDTGVEHDSREVKATADSESLNRLFGFKGKGSGVFNEVRNHESAEMDISRTARAYLLDLFGNENNKLIRLIRNHSVLHDFFVEFVSPRGAYSAIRVGAQPYGILPVGDFRNLELENRTMQNVQKILVFLSEKWNVIAEMNHVVDKQNACDEFLQLMGKSPMSSNYNVQESVSIPNFLRAEYFKGSDGGSDPVMEISKLLGEDFTKEEIEPYFTGFDFLPIIDPQFTSTIKDDDIVGQYTDGLIKKIAEAHNVTIEKKDAARHIKEFIDLFTYRLDAWMLGLLYYDRASRMNRAPGHIAIGSYGWVFDLKNKSQKTRTEELSDFIVAPSINQAITAAVLRGAYLNRLSSDTDTEVVDINLSSARVRKALRIIEGVRNGLPIGAILGSDAERLLHDAHKPDHYGTEMDGFIWPLRKKFPLKVAVGGASKPSDNTKVTPNVFNGAQLIQSLRDKVNDPDNNKNIYEYFSGADGKPTDDFKEWCKEIEGLSEDERKIAVFLTIVGEIYDSYDALMDVALSDSIYQLCKGNVEAATAIMNAMESESMIPLPGVTEVPVDSARIENKVIIAADATESTPGCGSYLYDADPRVGKWMEEVLCLDSHPENMMAADIVYLSSDKEKFSTFMNHLSFTTGDYGFAKLVEETEYIAESIRSMLSQSRHLKFEDLMKDSAPVAIEQFYDYADISGRYNRMYREVNDIATSMEELLGNPLFGEPSSAHIFLGRVEQALWRSFRMGVTEAVDILKEEGIIENGSGSAPNLSRAAERLLMLVRARMSSADKRLLGLGEVKGGLLDEAQKNLYIKAMKDLSTSDLMIVPVAVLKNYKVTDADGNESEMVPLDQLHAQTKDGFFKNVDSAELDEWLGEMATLRPIMHDMYIQQMYSSMTTFESNPLSLYPMQLPVAKSGDMAPEWLGTQVSSEEAVFDANVYLVSHPENLPVYNGDDPCAAGLVVDFWTETVPLRDQTAGLAFNFDQPDAEPPQSILLAMPETRIGNMHWTERRLSRSIKCALHLVKCRAVEPDHMYSDRWASGIFPLIDIELSNQ